MRHDPACVLDGGVHEFIIKPSYAMYQFASIMHHASVSRMVDLGMFIPKADVTDEVCEKIRLGLLESRFVSRLIKKYFNGGN